LSERLATTGLGAMTGSSHLPRGTSMRPPELPDVARAILKNVIVSLGATGLISPADAERLIQQLGLDDA